MVKEYINLGSDSVKGIDCLFDIFVEELPSPLIYIELIKLCVSKFYLGNSKNSETQSLLEEMF